MKYSIAKRALGGALVMLFLLNAGCASDPRYSEDEFQLPKKESAESAMIIGRIALPDNKEENPEGRYLWLFRVVFQNPERGVYGCGGTMPCGERAYTMYNSYFVVPNLKPGKYYFRGFATGNVYNSLPFDKDKAIELKPGQILFLGSFDYLEGEHNGAKRFFGLNGSYSLRPAKNPGELQMLQWLHGTSSGSGWESSIANRIKTLGGKVVAETKQSATPKTKK